jgi:antitoxin (DNA-binding transcriptional repressor) of toxin-antitoxin stability system
MRTVNATTAKRTLGALLDAVELGEVIVITRGGRPIARLIIEPSHRPPSVTKALAQIKAIGTQFGRPPDDDFTPPPKRTRGPKRAGA